MAEWRLAQSLVVLRQECNAVAPNRRKYNDGTIGDAAHAARSSRHNPNAQGVVTALDITHDPANGMDCGSLFEYLRTHPHPNLCYIIHNRQVARRASGWVVKNYTGSNPHTGHIHISVGLGTDGNPLPPYDDTTSWGLAAWKGQAETPKEEEDMTDAERKLLTETNALAKQNRVSDVARSWDMEIIKAMVAGEPQTAVDALESQKSQKVREEKAKLGL